MRFEGVSRVEQRRDMLDAVARFGITVGEACQLYNVSRQTFYYWARREATEGEEGLENRSTAPRRSPGRIQRTLESQIVDMRTAHRRWGARRIRDELLRKGVAAPARSTIEQVIERNGLGRAPAPKPPAPIRFERQRVNELWQTDAKQWALSDGTEVEIISCLDDRSRLCCAIEAFLELSGNAAISVFDAACDEWGPPESVLSDRGSIFTGRTKHTVCDFERHVWTKGVYTLNGRPYHPQTQGKVERFHRTLIEWLEDEGPFHTLDALNASLVEFRRHYNEERPNQALGEATTPAEVFAAVDKAGPDPELAAERCRREVIRPTAETGHVNYGAWVIGLGRVWARTKVRVIDTGEVIQVWAADGSLIREVVPDPTRSYLGTGKPRGRPARMY